ncbi:MAG: RsmD family RNA methyltransferase [Pseudomonadota bacterium]
MTDYTIEKLGFQGDGVAAGPIYAPRTVPGDTVVGRLDGQTLKDVKIVKPSGDRVKPPCPRFRSCGGCQLQHISDDFVAAWKADVIRAALASHDLSPEILPTLTSPPSSRRRATFSARRTKKGARAGFHALGSDVIIEIPNCTLITQDLLGSLEVCEDLSVVGASRKGSLSVTATASTAGLDISATGGKPLDQEMRLALAGLAERRDLARLVWEGELIAQRRLPYQVFGGIKIGPPPGAFLQATKHGEQTLQSLVMQTLEGRSNILDLFAGCGTFALPLARRAQVHAVEGSKQMVEALDRAWRDAEALKHVSVEARDLFRRPMDKSELGQFDGVAIDPPRAGAIAQVRELARSKIPSIAYVSCNPTTFARDAKILVEGGYELTWVQPVDQFRWSTHVELAAEFVRAG